MVAATAQFVRARIFINPARWRARGWSRFAHVAGHAGNNWRVFQGGWFPAEQQHADLQARGDAHG